MAGDPEELDSTSGHDDDALDRRTDDAMWDDAARFGDSADDDDDDHGDGPGDWVALETPLEPSADADIIANARRRYGSGGALLAAGMLGLDNILREKFKPDSVQVQEAPTDPVDVDADGIQVTIDETLSVSAPALERTPLLEVPKKRRRG